MNNYGRDFDSYQREANDNTAVVVMVESKEAVERMDEILAVDGVDGAFIGPYDLSGSYGMVGKLGDPVIVNACKKMVRACERAGKSAGAHIVLPTPDAIRRALDDGMTFLALGVDSVFLHHASRDALAQARALTRPQT
jgi:2-keto-3-deoxy-L-rhamnonate aldolase RhmA